MSNPTMPDSARPYARVRTKNPRHQNLAAQRRGHYDRSGPTLHRAGCRSLAGHDVQPLSLQEAGDVLANQQGRCCLVCQPTLGVLAGELLTGNGECGLNGCKVKLQGGPDGVTAHRRVVHGVV